ncbi:hypothetical protein ACNPNQ_23195 [Serratia odorifera]
MARLRQVIERFGESRFTWWESAAAKIDEHGPRTIDRLGFRKTLEHGMGDDMHTTNTYYVLPEAWRAEIFKGMNISAVNKELLQRGVLEPGSDGKAYSSIRLPGLGRQRCYVVKTVPGTMKARPRPPDGEPADRGSAGSLPALPAIRQPSLLTAVPRENTDEHYPRIERPPRPTDPRSGEHSG